MVFNATFNNISVISWQSVLLVEKIGVPGENHRPVASHWQTFAYNVVSGTPCHEWGLNSLLSYDHYHDGPSFIMKLVVLKWLYDPIRVKQQKIMLWPF